MDRFFNYAIIRFSPDDIRGERLNIGIAVLGETFIDIRVSQRLDRVKVMSAALDTEALADLLNNLKGIDDSCRREKATTEERLERLSQIGPLKLSGQGSFRAKDQAAFEDRIASILKRFVEPEPANSRSRVKKSKLLTEVRNAFRSRRILAKKGENLQSHRIVCGLELDQGLVADLVLRNGAYHIVETVDASGDEHAIRKAVANIAISALVLERARMQFGQEATKGKLVYTASSALENLARPSLEAAEHQGTELINWASVQDRIKFVDSLAILAKPIENVHRKQLSIRSRDMFH